MSICRTDIAQNLFSVLFSIFMLYVRHNFVAVFTNYLHVEFMIDIMPLLVVILVQTGIKYFLV